MAADAAATLTLAAQELDDLNRTLALTNDATAQAQLRTQIKYWQGVYQAASGQARAAEMPSDFALSLSGIGDSLQGFVSSQTGKVVTILAVGALVIFGLPRLVKAFRK